jgi:hypothetical protein
VGAAWTFEISHGPPNLSLVILSEAKNLDSRFHLIEHRAGKKGVQQQRSLWAAATLPEQDGRSGFFVVI